MELNLWEGITQPKKTILSAALKVFAKNGYTGATTREIAKEAGVANGLIFYHYKDKQMLFFALAQHLRTVVAKQLQANQTATDDFYTWVEQVVQQKLLFYSGYPDVYLFFMLQIREFPEQFEKDGREVRSVYPIWPGDSGVLAHEILYSALNGMTAKLIEDFQAGILSADNFVKTGMEKASTYIEFFKASNQSLLP